MKVARSNSGFHLWVIALVIGVFGVLALVTLQVMNKSESKNSSTASPTVSSTTQQTTTQPTAST
jgi:Tfp pilus assembly protein PilV